MGRINHIVFLTILLALISCNKKPCVEKETGHRFNENYTGENLDRIAFPVGGIGAGMFCIEGTGAISNMSVKNHPDLFFEPNMFAAISVKGYENGAKVLEGPVPDWKKFGRNKSGDGTRGANYGLPHFEEAEFKARFPFCEIKLKDKDIPLDVTIKGWSPFVPSDADDSSLPVGAIEYTIKNTNEESVETVFSYNAQNFMESQPQKKIIKPLDNGFILSCKNNGQKEAADAGDFAIFTNEAGTKVNHCWFRGGWFDPLTMAWDAIKKGEIKSVPPVDEGAAGASLYIPVNLKPGESKTIVVMMAWYTPQSTLCYGEDPVGVVKNDCEKQTAFNKQQFYKPWYTSRFQNIDGIVNYWRSNYDLLKDKSELFTNTFFNSTLPPEVIEAVAANLSILKSPTMLRQPDGRLWCFEGTGPEKGKGPGTCTHVWNYAQSVSHLFPSLERTLRETEFTCNQDERGHQVFRSAMPIRPIKHDFYAAADGQLGGIMKIFRDWRISGDNEWMKKMYPQVKKSMDYCIETWDPRHKGVLEEPHHNTYDIEFWGPDGMCTSIYLGALEAFSEMTDFVGEDAGLYKDLKAKGKVFMETELFNGSYFFHKVQTTGLDSPSPVELSKTSWTSDYSEEALELLKKEGPKYQYGTGCLSDGVIGSWVSMVCGLSDPLSDDKVKSHLNAVYKYNMKHNLEDHDNPQRPTYAIGKEGGLLLCTWPNGGQPTLPFVYSNEVWTGIEYQVAAHLMSMGEVEKGLDIVRTCRNRYDGKIRNPFDEYEFGHWYARAMASYSMLQALTGVRYDAVSKTLFIDSQIGDFTSFLSTDTGFGNVGFKEGKPFFNIVYGYVDVNKIIVSGVEIANNLNN